MRLGVVVLAAGRSSRMGRPKLLLPWGRTSIIGHLLAEWEKLGAEQIGVVCAANADSLSSELDRVEFPGDDRIVNAYPERGMFSSLQCAASWPGWKDGLTHWAVILGDQPHLELQTLRAIIVFSQQYPDKICVPYQGGHRRHPVILPKQWFLQLGPSTVRDLRTFLDLAGQNVALCPLQDPGLELDLDRPEDYERAKEMFLKH